MAGSRPSTPRSTAASSTSAATPTTKPPWPHTDIAPIDLVVVNLYPFEATVARPGVSLHDAIENIDIGGPSMLRSAAKNHESVTVVTDPADYEEVAAAIAANGETTLELRRRLAAKVYARTAAYDAAIAAHLQRAFSPRTDALPALTLAAPLAQPLRYGENPHQKAALRAVYRILRATATARNSPTTTSST
jgi:phosphoribosylaminoimidazolecarboxamide formyltransferase/IMP cyclohydrolase